MLCARCGQEKGIKEFEDELLCSHCFDIRIKAHTILELVCKGDFSYSDRLAIERLKDEINMEKHKMYARYLRVFNTMQKFREVYTLDIYDWDSPAHPYTKEKFYELHYRIKKIVEVCDVMLAKDNKAKEIKESHPFGQSMEMKLYSLLWNCDPIDDREVDAYFYH